jgi:hypothetical protein
MGEGAPRAVDGTPWGVDVLGGVDTHRSHTVHERRVHRSKVLAEDMETAVNSLWDGRFRSLDDDKVGRNGDESGGDRYIKPAGDECLIGSDNVRRDRWTGLAWSGTTFEKKKACNKHMSLYMEEIIFVTNQEASGRDQTYD